MDGLLYQGGPCGVLFDFDSTFSLILLHPEGEQGQNKKGNRILDGEVSFTQASLTPGWLQIWMFPLTL